MTFSLSAHPNWLWGHSASYPIVLKGHSSGVKLPDMNLIIPSCTEVKNVQESASPL
jgi:hypothetical protein